MPNKNLYELPMLPYGYGDLEPYISEEQLRIHHDKHHQAYVNGANGIFEKMAKARKENIDLDAKALLKELSFNIGGHALHSLFWKNLAPSGKGGGGEPKGELEKSIKAEFGSFERFKKEFSQAAQTVEGSGWAALSWNNELKKPQIMQIEKHNANLYPEFRILMVLDMFEHAYYIDYKNDKAKFIEIFWNIISWNEAEKRILTI